MIPYRLQAVAETACSNTVRNSSACGRSTTSGGMTRIA